nr:hypothetical protein [Nakamurella leprariae]
MGDEFMNQDPVRQTGQLVMQQSVGQDVLRGPRLLPIVRHDEERHRDIGQELGSLELGRVQRLGLPAVQVQHSPTLSATEQRDSGDAVDADVDCDRAVARPPLQQLRADGQDDGAGLQLSWQGPAACRDCAISSACRPSSEADMNRVPAPSAAMTPTPSQSNAAIAARHNSTSSTSAGASSTAVRASRATTPVRTSFASVVGLGGCDAGIDDVPFRDEDAGAKVLKCVTDRPVEGRCRPSGRSTYAVVRRGQPSDSRTYRRCFVHGER